MKIYICGSQELDLVEHYMNRLRAMGHVITHDWTAAIRAKGSANPRASHADRHRWAQQDLTGVEQADYVWLLMPSTPSFGASLEAGYALGYAGATVIVSGDWRASIFTAYFDARFDAHDDALEWIRLQDVPGDHAEAMDVLERQ